jgi:hypothetical protein
MQSLLIFQSKKSASITSRKVWQDFQFKCSSPTTLDAFRPCWTTKWVARLSRYTNVSDASLMATWEQSLSKTLKNAQVSHHPWSISAALGHQVSREDSWDTHMYLMLAWWLAEEQSLAKTFENAQDSHHSWSISAALGQMRIVPVCGW